MDHFTPYPGVKSMDGKNTILSIKDSFSKFVTLIPCRTYAHVEIVDALRTYVGTFGSPLMIIVDNALTSQELERFCDISDIKLLPTPVARPQANGQVERIHRDLRKYFSDILAAMDLPVYRWTEVVSIVTGLINSIPHSVTLHPPEELQIGRFKDHRIPISKEVANKYKQVQTRLQNQQSKPNHLLDHIQRKN